MVTVLYMVIPCYNETLVLEETSRRLKEKYRQLISAGKIDKKSRIVYVNDGSTDNTWKKIQSLHEVDPCFSGLNLSRNRGHQNALLAGLMTVKNLADCVISMDADLQDDVERMDEMLEQFEKGFDIVYAVRDNRETDRFFKRNTAALFYRLMGKFGSQSLPNHADFRLMSRRALQGLAQFPEVNLYLRGLVPLVGYPSTIVYYQRGARFAGESHYPLKKMINFAVDGITSTTATPMRLIFWTGFVSFIFALLAGIYVVILHFTKGMIADGWASLMIAMVAFGGMNLLAIGIVGEYIGKIFMEVKQRPRYLIQEFLNQEVSEEPLLEQSERSTIRK